MASERFFFEACLSCGASFMSPRPQEENIGRFYPEDYGPFVPATGNTGRRTAGPRKATKAPAKWKRLLLAGLRRTNQAADRLWPNPLRDALRGVYDPGRSRRFLDFGCGSDAFLNKMRDSGWDTIGMDVSANTVAAVEKSGHRGIVVDADCWNKIPDSSVDLVRMNHVLEHLYRPKQVLKEIKKKLRPEGRLHIAVPNPASLGAKAFKSAWYPLECPRHIIFYPPSALKTLLESVGFHDVRILQEALGKDLARSIGYFLHERGKMTSWHVEDFRKNSYFQEALHIPGLVLSSIGMADRIHALVRA